MMMEQQNNDLPIFVKWILLKTDKFPKKVRFTFSNRISNLAVDIAESLIEARYSKQKIGVLREVNLNLEKLRILFRISYELRFISHESYQFGVKKINEVGKMLGGWMKNRNEIYEKSQSSF